MKNTLPSQEYLKECFDYNPETGELFWKERPLYHFKNERGHILFNSRFAKNQFGGVGEDGYRRGGFNGKKWRAHRIIWKLFYNEEPEIILHSSGNKDDNRISFLSNGSQELNAKDQKLRKNNTSGVMGVTKHSQSNKWIVRINNKHDRKYLGVYDTIEEAIAVRKAAEIEYGYHPEHGLRL